MSETPIPVSQHFALWDVARGSGWVSLHHRRDEVARAEIDSYEDFGVLISMLADRSGLWFDPEREVLTRVAGPVPAGVEDGMRR